ncbi:MAG: membrane integrity-associated transporter subunit PqiC [Deltaproteobacteria bacterium]|nr:membrane integrity-associated transporter subunit PqiC [Deltaproteobacteria bacterium]
MNTMRYCWILGMVLCMTTFSGCLLKSQPAKYYTLNPLQRLEARPDFTPRFTVSVGPVILPDSLKRPQIAIRTSDNQVGFSEFHKWAGPLKDDVKHILAENIGILLADEGATVSTDELLIEPDYRVVVNVNRFDGVPGETAWLNAVWTLKDQKSQKIVAVTQSLYTEKVSGPGYPDLVNAQSKTLASLSLEIAAEIKKLQKSP